MRNPLVIAAAVVFVLIGAAQALRGGQGQDAAPAAPAAPAQAPAQAPVDVNIREAYQERLTAAREVVASIDKRLDAGEAQTTTFLEFQAQAYKRLADAEIAAAADKAARVAAAGQHLRRCEQMLKVIDARFKHGLDASLINVQQAKYHLADAKVTLAEAMARP
jgi:hypothetical protein